MTEIEIAERIISSLQDKRDRAVKRSQEISAERAALGYSAHVDGDAKSKARLIQLSADLAAMSGEIETIDGALVEATRRAAVARQVVVRADAKERSARARVILEQLEARAPELDRVVPHPEGGVYSPNDPPLHQKTAALAGALCDEMRALRIADVTFPAHYRWDVASKTDLADELRKTVWAGWPKITWPVERPQAIFGERRYNPVSFQKIFEVWFKAVRASLQRHEQTNNETEVAA